jgi:hypothetical protein
MLKKPNVELRASALSSLDAKLSARRMKIVDSENMPMMIDHRVRPSVKSPGRSNTHLGDRSQVQSWLVAQVQLWRVLQVQSWQVVLELL